MREHGEEEEEITCFTGTKVQILTPEAPAGAPDEGARGGGGGEEGGEGGETGGGGGALRCVRGGCHTLAGFKLDFRVALMRTYADVC
jgi:hypothetical protein